MEWILSQKQFQFQFKPKLEIGYVLEEWAHILMDVEVILMEWHLPKKSLDGRLTFINLEVKKYKRLLYQQLSQSDYSCLKILFNQLCY